MAEVTDPRAGDTRLQAVARRVLNDLRTLTTQDFERGYDRPSRIALADELLRLDKIREDDQARSVKVSKMTRAEQNEHFGEGGVLDAEEDQAYLDRQSDEAEEYLDRRDDEGDA
jgi:hypothetical protein